MQFLDVIHIQWNSYSFENKHYFGYSITLILFYFSVFPEHTLLQYEICDAIYYLPSVSRMQ